MKTIIRYHFLFSLMLLTSCTKVINVNLNSAGPEIVIEGNLNDGPGPYLVRLTQTVNFSDPNLFPPVTGAIVLITDVTAGYTDSLAEGVPGTYTTKNLTHGVPGHQYQLFVSTNGETYTASSTMPLPVALDSVSFYSSSIFGKTRTNAVANFQDPAGIANYYTFTEYLNGQQVDRTFDFNDRLSDGKYVRLQLFNDSTINPGDKVRIEMHCVDNPVWQYFNTLGQAKGNNSQSVTPANPVSNISNNALGYFSAQTIQIKEADLP
jgi:hypothetical protein